MAIAAPTSATTGRPPDPGGGGVEVEELTMTGIVFEWERDPLVAVTLTK